MPALLLVGAAAEALAPRLAISGYAPLRPAGTGSEPVPLDPPSGRLAPLTIPDPITGHEPPLAVIVSPGEEARIPELRRRWGARPLLLGVESDSVQARRHTLLHGADDFWLSGRGPSDLLTRLRLHRQSLPGWDPPPAERERLQVADLQLIPASARVRRGERPVSLTAREYQLLLLLLEQRGQVVSREQILRRIWPDQPPGGNSNVIEVYVRYLRHKLEQGGERRLLHTVRGRGYCLCDGPAPSGREG